ncbi:MAG: nucleotide exchange factor GrpE, partial [Candidatus Binatia bacterium]
MTNRNRDNPSDGGRSPGVEATAEARPQPESRIAELEEELRRKSEEAASNYDRYLRGLAEVENFKKRMQREKSEAIRFGNEGVLHDLLPIVDNLEAALEHAELGGNGKSVVEGVQLILRLFRELLERHGVKEITDPTGQPFDPVTQEAAEVEASAAAKP